MQIGGIEFRRIAQRLPVQHRQPKAFEPQQALLAQAVSLAKSLAKGPLVLMRGHGATVVGASVRDVVFRAVHSCREADSLRRAALLGEVHPLSPGEIEKARHVRAPILERCWSHWLATMNSGSEKGTA